MNYTNKLSILEDALGDFIQIGSEFLFYCPFCKHHKKKMSINISKNFYKCWICGKSSKNISNIFWKVGAFSEKQQWLALDGIIDFSDETIFADFFDNPEIKQYKKIELPEEFKTLTSQTTILNIEAKKYLDERHLTKVDIAKWKMGYCGAGEYKERIIIPSFDNEGNLNFFTTRTYNKNNWPPYRNPKANKDIVFNEIFLDPNKPLTVVEGPFDAVIADNSVPLLGSNLREDSNIFQFLANHNCKEIYFALDYDARKREKNIIKKLLKYDKKPFKIPIPEQYDVGAMTKNEFKSRKEKAKAINTEQLMLEELNEI